MASRFEPGIRGAADGRDSVEERRVDSSDRGSDGVEVGDATMIDGGAVLTGDVRVVAVAHG